MTQATTTSDPGFRLVSSTIRDLTPDFAREFSTLKGSPTERAMNPARVKDLTEKAEAGRLITFNWSTVKLGDETLRMNGQHSSRMLTGLNGLFPQGLKVHLDEYVADDAAAVALLFRQFDYKKGVRSSADVAGAYQGVEEALKEIPRDTAKLGAEGVAWHQLHVDGTSGAKGDDRYMVMHRPATHGFLQWLGGLISLKTPELKQAAVVAAMYATFVNNEAEARRFWRDVARGGEEYDENSPATRLDAWLKSLKESPDQKKGMKPGNYYQGCVYAWNAFRGEKPITNIRYTTSKGLNGVAE